MRREVQFQFPKGDRFTITWIVALVVLWIATTATYRWAAFGPTVFDWLTFDLGDVRSWRLWTAVTYVFFHSPSSPFPLLLSCLMLYFFAPQMRSRWGNERFFLFVVLTALGGAAGATVAGLFGIPAVAMGAGAIIVGLFVAWGLTYPDRTIYVMFVIPMRGIHMVYITAFVILLEMLATATSASVHAGGLVVAVVLVTGFWRGNRMRLWWDNLLTLLRIRKKPKLTLVPPMGGKGPKGPDKYVH